MDPKGFEPEFCSDLGGGGAMKGASSRGQCSEVEDERACRAGLSYRLSQAEL
jgi:hypothetical protein